jgi:trans-2,3-dihydro-3-hydroxyanthranilate isomerase
VADLRYVHVDVFTDKPLEGNQLAVFTDARGVDDATMQALAVEIGFAEITFVLPPEAGGHARVRIFNPRHEMPFAGHPVLGTAFVLGAPLQLGVITLETGRGPVDVELERGGSGRIVFGRMEQPLPEVRAVPEADELLSVLGVERSEPPALLYDNGATHIFVTLPSEEAVAALAPDPAAIAGFGVTGVNCIAGSGTRWKTRMFWPDGEDAATGSAAGPLAVHACRHGLAPWGEWLEISQGVEIGRPSTLHALAEEDGGEVTRVAVGGNAVAVARGEFRL